MKTTLALAILLCYFGAVRAEPPASPVPGLQELEKSAAEGDAAANFQLARAYFRGQGVEKNEEKAVALLREAAGAGNLEAMDSLGFLYSQGQGVTKDEEIAAEWFRKAADAGSPSAQLNLGLMLRQGKSIPLSNEESLRWMQAAADSGYPRAVSTLGQLYGLGDKLVLPDFSKARPYLLAAAEAGDPSCQNMMGVICRDGVGPAAEFKDHEEALAWFRKAAEQNDAKAQSNLAHLMGVESPACENRKEALVWLLIAGNQGEATSLKTLKEIREHLPASLLMPAEKEAMQFTIRHLATGQKNQP